MKRNRKRMAHYARNADLVILAQPNPAHDNRGRLREFVPLLVVEKIHGLSTELDKVFPING